jgi:GT2 family glycosyltransferase
MLPHTAPRAVVVNYRTPAATLACVRSLVATGTHGSDIIVIENGSGDDSSAQLSAGLPGSRLFTVPTNLGFAGGCNIGIRHALAEGAEFVLLINSDAEIRPGALDALCQALERDPSLGIVGPILVSTDGAERVESLGIRYSAASGRMRHIGWGQRLSETEPFGVRRVDGISGCAMLMRREVFERTGLLNEAYFFGFEDLEFCLRARTRGFESACVGQAIVAHERNRSIGRRSPARIYYATRNHLRLVASDSSADGHLRRLVPVVSTLALNLTHALTTSEVRLSAGVRGFWRGVRDHFAGRYGAAPAQLE